MFAAMPGADTDGEPENLGCTVVTNTTHILEHAPELAAGLEETRWAHAVIDLVADTLTVEAGPWDPTRAAAHSRPALGFLITSGLLLRRVALGGRFGAELLEPGDLISPLETDPGRKATAGARWSALMPSEVAVLDERFAEKLGSYPEVLSTLVSSSMRRARHAAVSMAIVHHPRIVMRVRMLLWDLAARWGVAQSDGIRVPVKLTHAVLADLAGARRPSVSTALGRLTATAEILATKDGWLLTGAPPAELELRSSA